MPGKSRVPSRNRATATSSAAISAADARLPVRPASRAMRSAGKRVSSGARKSSRRRGHEVRRRRRRREALGVRQGVLDGETHVGGAQLCLQRAVDEQDGGVDDALRMHDDVDGVVADIVQPVGLDDLQALVGERRGVDRDLGSHGPGRVPQGLRRGDGGELRPASRRGTGPPDAVSTRRAIPAPGSPTRHCQIAECSESIGRSHASGVASGSRGSDGGPRGGPGPRLGHHQVAAGDQRLLVGGRDDLAGAQRREHGPERHDARRCRRSRGRRRRGWRAARGRRRPERARCRPGRSRAAPSSARATAAGRRRRAWASSSARVAAGREGHDPEPVRVRLEHLDGLAADAPGRAEQRDAEAAPLSGRARGHTARRPGPANRNESMRSRIPPWPGMSVPESLAPAARLSIDSARSPAWAASPSSGPSTSPPTDAWPRPGEQQARHHGRRHEAADEALDRLGGRDVGHELVAADLAAHEIGAGVVAPDAQHEQQDPALRGARARRAATPPGIAGPVCRDVEHERDQADVQGPEHRREPGHQPVARVLAGERADAGEHDPDRDQQEPLLAHRARTRPRARSPPRAPSRTATGDG